jgi:hypothetical protein
MKRFKVYVTRTTFDGQNFIVEAEDENEAHEKAILKAGATDWGTGNNVEYEVEDITSEGDEDWGDDGGEESEDPRDNPLLGEDDWIHDVEMGAR